MKNIEASVGAVPTHKKKEVGEQEIEEREYIRKKNEMIFFLKECPNCQITGVAEWCENSLGDILTVEPDTYFRHILTGQRCETPWGCLIGVAEFNEYHEEIWETLCMRITNHENIEEDMCYEKRVEL